MAGVIPGLDYQFMHPLQLKVQGPVESDNPRLHIHDKVALRVTLAPVDFIEHQTIIALIFICCKHLQRQESRTVLNGAFESGFKSMSTINITNL